MVTTKKQTTLTPKSMTKPYKETIQEKHGTGEHYIIRTFSKDIEESDLIWHRDHHSRRIHVLQGEGWKLQTDDSLPQDLKVGKEYFVTQGEYHRLLKGTNDLIIRIQERIIDN